MSSLTLFGHEKDRSSHIPAPVFGGENRHLGWVAESFHAFGRLSVKAKLLVRTKCSLHGARDTAFQAETGRMDTQKTAAHPFSPC